MNWKPRNTSLNEFLWKEKFECIQTMLSLSLQKFAASKDVIWIWLKLCMQHMMEVNWKDFASSSSLTFKLIRECSSRGNLILFLFTIHSLWLTAWKIYKILNKISRSFFFHRIWLNFFRIERRNSIISWKWEWSDSDSSIAAKTKFLFSNACSKELKFVPCVLSCH